MTLLDGLLLFGVGLVAGVVNILAGGGSLLTLPVLLSSRTSWRRGASGAAATSP